MRRLFTALMLVLSASAFCQMKHDFPHITIYTPEFSKLELRCIDRPSEEDTTILLCMAGAFTHDALLEFGHENIDGNHVASGIFYEGARSKDLTGVFKWCEGGYVFAMKNDSQISEQTAQQYVTAFEQAMVILDGKAADFPVKKYYEVAQHYRVLAEWQGRICMVESDITTMDVFVNAMLEAGVTNAIYTDMGGWRFAWYRDAEGRVRHIHPEAPRTRYQSNWLCFIR